MVSQVLDGGVNRSELLIDLRPGGKLDAEIAGTKYDHENPKSFSGASSGLIPYRKAEHATEPMDGLEWESRRLPRERRSA